MDDHAHRLPAIVEAGLAAAAERSRAVSLAAGIAAIRRAAAPAGEAGVRRRQAEAVFDQAFAAPGPGDFGRVSARLTLAALAARGDLADGQEAPSSSSNSSR